MKNFIYSSFHFKFLDKFLKYKRESFFRLIESKIDWKDINSYLDIGTTRDATHESSNYLNKKFEFIKIHKAISDQKIDNDRFSNTLKKSIIDDFSKEEIDTFSSDFTISNATIEHVGSEKNQIKMIDNMIKLSNKVIVIQTINRFFPLETHTKIPFLHFLPKKIHRKILKFVGYDYYSLEENLNLLSYNDFKIILKNFENEVNFKIYKIYSFGLLSNILIIGFKK